LDATSQEDLKAIAAINKAVKIVDEAVELLIKKNTEALDLKLWQTAAELEYASFLISVKHGFANYFPNSGHIDSNVEALDSLVAKIQETLENAALVLRSNPKEAYDRIKRATALVRRAQSILRGNSH